MRGVWPAVVVAVLTGCPGLLVGPGNDFPCDFARPPGERDAVCSPGDVCGVSNRCQRYVDEGPQFEGAPTFPQFTAEVGSGVVVHPKVLTGAVEAVVTVPPRAVFVRTADGTFLVEADSPAPTRFDAGFDARDVADVIVFPRDGGWRTFWRERDGDTFFRDSNSPGSPQPLGIKAAQWRRLGPQRIGVIIEGRQGFGVVEQASMVPSFQRLLDDAGTALFDVVPGPSIRLGERPAVLLAREALLVEGADGGFVSVAAVSLPPPPMLPAERRFPSLSIDEAGAVAAVLSRTPPLLTTLVTSRTGFGLEVASAWPDCVPCPRAFVATPGLDRVGPFVDVLCEGSIRRVRGALPGGRCLEELIEPPFDVSQVSNREPVLDTTLATGFAVGGLSGQVWVGRTVGTAQPVFMERVPVDVSKVGLADGTSPVFALTTAGLFDGRPERGYLSIAPEATSRIAALVGEGQGWVVGEGGNLVRVSNVGKASPTVRFGPRLIDGRGEAVTRPLRGEAFVGVDAGVASMLIAADDSLYFLVPPRPAESAGQLGDLAPVATPEPSSFIRSLAIERTPVDSDGVERVHAYVVTSRNVFDVTLGGAPRRWTATPLTFSAAGPLEVWFDNPQSRLARVGYVDGTVFSIPGGFQLTERLPAASDGSPIAVVDYDNLGGWPVALTEHGLFVARYDEVRPGQLDNRFPDGGVNKPMSWREVVLPDGSRPWRQQGPRFGAKPAKIFVLAEAPTSAGQTFRLLVYLPTQVIEVGRHVRTR
ncbi:MAG: hypothetical protein SFW67_19430 [Myxococcaceae bacterium]|nr:hypothetical protein [Myxococcaceae bacterium]